MTERAGDWRTEAGLIRFPEDNDVIGVAIDAGCRKLTENERIKRELVGLALGEYARCHPEEQGKPVCYEGLDGTKYIARVPWDSCVLD